MRRRLCWKPNKKFLDKREGEIQIHIEQLQAGHENHLAALYSMLPSGDEVYVNKAAEAIHTYMSSLDAANIIRLERVFRQYTSMEWCIDWAQLSLKAMIKNITDSQMRLSILRLGTLHPNGYFREKCMKALANDEASFGYIALRLNDWVLQIRATAYEILADRLDGVKVDTAVGMLPFISRTKKGERYISWQFQEIEGKLSEKIRLHLHEIALDTIRDYPPATKRFLYKALISPEVLSRQAAQRLLEREKSGNEKALVIRLILQKYECSETEIEAYLQNKSPIVRKKALEVRYERLGTVWEGIEEFLLDTARGIRSDVCYILRRHTKFDIPSYYRNHLHTKEEAVAILGVGENGSAKDADVLAAYLYADRPRLVKNALTALSALRAAEAGGVRLADVYWDYLEAADTSVAKAAYHAICKSDIFYGAAKLYRRFVSCTNDNTRKYLIRLLVKEPSWERLPYLLMLYEPDRNIDDVIQFWVYRAIRFRSVYARITREWADFIMETLEQRKDVIPDGLKKEIVFDLEHITIVCPRKPI